MGVRYQTYWSYRVLAGVSQQAVHGEIWEEVKDLINH